jgi:hypothetical protein
MGMRFSQEQFFQVPLTETEDQGEARQDEQGEGHDPGHPVVFVVAVAVGVVIMPVGAVPVGLVFHVGNMPGDL